MERFTIESRAGAPNFEEDLQRALSVLYSYEQAEFYMDKGGVGTVYSLPNGSCIKILDSRHSSPNSHMFDLGNKPGLEFKLQEKVFFNKFNGVTRVPEVFGVFETTQLGSKSAIIMEKLDATNIQHILNGSAELPPNFSLDEFFSDLEKFVQHMHENIEIAHNDLFARNIMVDRLSAQPRVIDFGRSIDLRKVPSEMAREKLKDADFSTLDGVYQGLNALQK